MLGAAESILFIAWSRRIKMDACDHKRGGGEDGYLRLFGVAKYTFYIAGAREARNGKERQR